MRRVLRAYAVHNTELGYCQSMNIITAFMLLFCSEEEAFYLLCTYIDQIPEYYVKELTGSTVDIKILTSLVEDYMPDMYNHFQEIGLDFDMLALPWFMCMFVSYAPWEIILRIADCLFYEVLYAICANIRVTICL